MYFGVTQQDLKKRWQQHKCNSNKKSYHLYNAIKKYGFCNFEIENVFEFETRKEMLEKEIELIYLNKTTDRLYGYNNSTGGESSRKGCKLTNEQKRAISEYQKTRVRKPHSVEAKLKMSLKAKGRDMSIAIRLSANSRRGKPSLNIKSVILNDKDVFSSLKEASKKTGVSVSSISNNIIGLSKSTKIGVWRNY